MRLRLSSNASVVIFLSRNPTVTDKEEMIKIVKQWADTRPYSALELQAMKGKAKMQPAGDEGAGPSRPKRKYTKTVKEPKVVKATGRPGGADLTVDNIVEKGRRRKVAAAAPASSSSADLLAELERHSDVGDFEDAKAKYEL
jgi:hypothetical protein